VYFPTIDHCTKYLPKFSHQVQAVLFSFCCCVVLSIYYYCVINVQSILLQSLL
jgi:hypothetical protein